MDNSVRLEDIRNRLNNIFKTRFNLDLVNSGESIPGGHLLGKEVRLAPRDLVYLFLDIEKEFAITIPEQEVVAGKFSSFNNIIEIISSRLGCKA
jgi:peptide maturation system acyl carrier-related protein